MSIESGVNPAQSNRVSAELFVDCETVVHHREPPPPYTPSAATTITTQPIVHQTIIVQTSLKGGPIPYNCPDCQETVLTTVKYVNTKKTHMLAGFICGFTCWCLICCLGALPYAINTFKKAEHYCPNCNKHLGDYSKI